MNRPLSWLLLAALALFAPAGFAADAPAPAATPTPEAQALATKAFPTGKLRWAADVKSSAPFAFDDPAHPGQLVGFEYEIITDIAQILGVTPELNNVDWDGLIPGLKTGGKYDCVICGIEYSEDRAREVDFSRPYYSSYEQLATRTEAAEVTNLDQLHGKRIGTLDQTGAFDLLKAAGIDPQTYDEEQNAYNDCARGRIDGVLLDFPIAMYYAKPNASLRFNGPPFGHISYVIAVKKGDADIQAALNYGLQQLIDSGRLREILSRWNLWNPTIADSLGQPVAPAGPPTAYEDFLAQAGKEVTWGERFSRLWEWRATLLQAGFNTLVISIFSMALAVAVGFVLAVVRVFAARPFQYLSMFYVEVVRGTPLLIQMLFIYYGLPNIGIRLTPWAAGILGLGLNYAAYEAENYRAGLLAVPRGQMEAARALGMSRRQALRHVVVPQAFRLVLPPLTNDFISLLKDSSLVTMISIMDLTNAYQRMATTYYDYFGTGLAIAVIYLLIGLPFVRLARRLEHNLAVDTRPAGQRPGLLPRRAKPNLTQPL
jgi:polar amino acid transport system substrate-binding protein